jgi:hypothetical protein
VVPAQRRFKQRPLVGAANDQDELAHRVEMRILSWC